MAFYIHFKFYQQKKLKARPKTRETTQKDSNTKSNRIFYIVGLMLHSRNYGFSIKSFELSIYQKEIVFFNFSFDSS